MSRGRSIPSAAGAAPATSTPTVAARPGFAVEAHRLEISPHPDADRIELARVGGYLSIVPKGLYRDGDYALYIPEQSIVPAPILEELGLTGKLAGSEKNRVKAMRLRGILSQGLIYRPKRMYLQEGHDYAAELGIVKWEAPIPVELSGQVIQDPAAVGYHDIENIKRFPDVLIPGEEVAATEKSHGSCSNFSLVDGHFAVTSKGQGRKGLALLDTLDEKGESTNAYWKMAKKFAVEEHLREFAERTGAQRITLFGETLGVQDLNYGADNGHLDFRAFDIQVDGRFLDHDEKTALFAQMGIPDAPVLYRGPHSIEALEQAACGSEQISGRELHMREGVVVRPVSERTDPTLGRVILKVISPDYLTRKGGTEFN